MMTMSRTKNQRDGALFQVEYIVQVQEIRPWPPTQSMRSLRSVLLQWENGDRNSGSTRPVSPSLGPGIGDGRIKFNESFRIPVNLAKDVSGDEDTYQKNCLEFNLYEIRRDKTVRGQLLGTAIIDLAEYGILTEKITISSQMNCKRSFRNTIQPLLFVKIQPLDKLNCSFSSRESLSKSVSLDIDNEELVSSLANGEYAEDSEIMSFTYDDVSSHSSLILSSSALESSGSLEAQNHKVLQVVKDINGRGIPVGDDFPFEPETAKTDVMLTGSPYSHLNRPSSRRSSRDLSQNRNQFGAKIMSSGANLHDGEKTDMEDNKAFEGCRNGSEDAKSTKGRHAGFTEEGREGDGQGHFKNYPNYSPDYLNLNQHLQDAIPIPLEDSPPAFTSKGSEEKGNQLSSERLRHLKSVQSRLDSFKSHGSLSNNHFTEVVKDIGVSEDVLHNGPRRSSSSDKRDGIVVRGENRNSSGSKIIQLENRIEKLEAELREAAAVEVALYSIVAEHGSSANKVHAPARRLFRLYLHACKQKSKARKASAAKSSVSGLTLVAKACGNDIPRLTFWLSNSVFLRTLVSEASGHDNRSPTKWKESSQIRKDKKLTPDFDDWENPNTFTNALEKIETWIFSRIIESMWWQIFTPVMQSASRKVNGKDDGSVSTMHCGRKPCLGDQEQVNYSLALWRKAFVDAYERLCPVRAEGHECGCLRVLARLMMDQCISRLDVAMFNAVLRESSEETPTDPMCDPISDSSVLPISIGKSSFGAGAQLKNAIGNWSRWITDLIGIDNGNNEHNENENELDNDERRESSFKSFPLLSSLSDLMMLPKDMLLDKSIRKEVCPAFSAPLIKKILNRFIPDEFCSDLVPLAVFDALDSEESFEVEGENRSLEDIPAISVPIIYLPPSADALSNAIKVQTDSKLRRSRSSVSKSFNSDDELDELDSPLTSIIYNNFQCSALPRWKTKENVSRNSVRYELLREVWRDVDQL